MAEYRGKDCAPHAAAPPWRHRTLHVRDLVLTAGAGGPAGTGGPGCRVRFNIELTVAENPLLPIADDIANVVCYADIVEGIRDILARRPVEPLAGFAEEIAAMALADPRVMRARVAVDLLEAHPEVSAVGVELVRSRDARNAADAHATAATGQVRPRPWVVKLGGSLSRSSDLASWLRHLAVCAAPVVVVPGGGAFADQVRESQARWQFDDSAAHHMALLAMDQMGRMFAALEPRLHLCSGFADFDAAFVAGAPAVWLPSAMALGQDGIAESWDVTSDSLAAWLAGRIGARGLVLVKSAEPPAGEAPAAELSRTGLVDRQFGRYLADSGVDAWCVGPGGAELTTAALAGGDIPGCRILAVGTDSGGR